MMAALELDDVAVRFGGVQAVDGVNLVVAQGDFVGLIGPNGAGKTSLFNCVSRLYNPTEGRIVFDGIDITRYKSKDIAQLGIARTFQNLALMKSLTVLQNVMLGGYHHGRTSLLRAPFVPVLHRSEETSQRRAAIHWIQALIPSRLPPGAPLTRRGSGRSR